jgi:hypothetical protein
MTLDEAKAKFTRALGPSINHVSVHLRKDGALECDLAGDYSGSAIITFAMLDAVAAEFGTKRIDLDVDAGYSEPSNGGGGMGHITIVVHAEGP